jgi:hypothetical protein
MMVPNANENLLNSIGGREAIGAHFGASSSAPIQMMMTANEVANAEPTTVPLKKIGINKF